MRKFLGSILKKLGNFLENTKHQKEALETRPPLDVLQKETQSVSNEPLTIKLKKTLEVSPKKEKKTIIPYVRNPARDLMEIMEVPFLALSKNRKNPIIYESSDGTRKVKISRHTGHFLASIYDWDIVLFIASKMQKILNDMSDIPPRSMIVPRHELLKAIHRRGGKKTDLDLEKTLSRLQLTGIETTVRNEDGRYRAGFGFLDSWKYTERKEIKEIEITLSQWLYDGICAKGSLLKVNPDYFTLTSGLSRFLYRTARKHVGTSNESWEFSLEKLYEKSGSESSFKLFKSKLKTSVTAGKIPDYSMEWIEKSNTTVVFFKRKQSADEIEDVVVKIEAQEDKGI
jgi:plasmid replication initiation protein